QVPVATQDVREPEQRRATAVHVLLERAVHAPLLPSSYHLRRHRRPALCTPLPGRVDRPTQTLQDDRTGQVGQGRARQDELAVAYPGTDDHVRGGGDAGIDEDRPTLRQADGSDPAVRHTGTGDRVLGGGEARLADVQVPADHVVDVGPG